MTPYQTLLTHLFSMGASTRVKCGIANCQRLQQALCHPDKAYHIVHVAGTNGKGSVCTKVAAALQSLGYRTGLYTSPHIACYRERISVDGTMITEEEVVALATALLGLCHARRIPTTFFELTTLIALEHFRKKHVDWAVLETGLGGRLDATNIVMPTICAIPSISLDHTHLLGTTIEEIAREKAAIVKGNTPCVIGSSVPAALVPNAVAVHTKGMHYEAENRAIATAVLRHLGIDPNSCQSALATLPPCRFQLLDDGNTILDVAHNPDGLQKLFDRVAALPPKPTCTLFGMTRFKEVDASIAIIAKHSAHIHTVSGTHALCISADELAKKIPHSTAHHTVAEGIAAAKKHNGRLVICGSFYIMDEAYAALGIATVRDSFNSNGDFSLDRAF